MTNLDYTDCTGCLYRDSMNWHPSDGGNFSRNGATTDLMSKVTFFQCIAAMATRRWRRLIRLRMPTQLQGEPVPGALFRHVYLNAYLQGDFS